MNLRTMAVAFALALAATSAEPALAGSEETPTPAASPAVTATPLPPPPPGPSGTASPAASPTPVATPSKKDTVRVFGREVGELPKTPSAGDLKKGLSGRFPYLRVAVGGGGVAIERSSTVDTSKTGGSKSDPQDSKLRGPSGSMEASLGIVLVPHLLLSGTVVANYVHVTEIDNEDGPDVELESGGQFSAVGLSVDWLQNPKGGEGLFAGAMLGGGAFSAELPENSVGIQRLGGSGPVLSLGVGYLTRLPHEKWRGGVQARVTLSPYLRGETEENEVVYREIDQALGVCLMATLSYF